ncbi:MAG: glycoside hydrolase family 31 protein, partial [Bacteroidales bacterium]|nr:glycoside hydrolase family 31 protein [Bacteroidales bacterium]
MKATSLWAAVGAFPLFIACSSTSSDSFRLPLDEGELKVCFVTPDIVHVQYSADGLFGDNGTIVRVSKEQANVYVHKVEEADHVRLISDSLEVCINRGDGSITYKDKEGKTLLGAAKNPYRAEKVWLVDTEFDENTKRTEKTADGEKVVMDIVRQDTIGAAWKYTAQFSVNENDALYGLGSHMEDYLNLRGKRLGLIQHNLKAVVPMLSSTGGYGLLFDAGSGMVYDDTKEQMQMTLEAAQTLDYYFMKGYNLDRTVAQYRYLTGNVPMQPRYMFGYIQSKERYVDAAELQGVVERYRENHLPLDVIVQDWMYWPSGWGYIHLDSIRYPNATALADTIH